GFCSPIELSMPAGVSQMRWGALPSRGAPVVPLSTMAPASRLLKPSTRVYSSPKPTQPDSSTIGEARRRPQNSSASDAGNAVGDDTIEVETASIEVIIAGGGPGRQI